jgi:hypothetical protein
VKKFINTFLVLMIALFAFGCETAVLNLDEEDAQTSSGADVTSGADVSTSADVATPQGADSSTKTDVAQKKDTTAPKADTVQKPDTNTNDAGADTTSDTDTSSPQQDAAQNDVDATSNGSTDASSSDANDAGVDSADSADSSTDASDSVDSADGSADSSADAVEVEVGQDVTASTDASETDSGSTDAVSNSNFCKDNCTDSDPYTYDYCDTQDQCGSAQQFISVTCNLPADATASTSCFPVAWVQNPGVPNVIDFNFDALTLWEKSSQLGFAPKSFCESLDKPGAVLRVNVIAFNAQTMSYQAIGGAFAKATDFLWWVAQNNPKKGKPDTASVFGTTDYTFTFADFPVCVAAKAEIEGNNTKPPYSCSNCKPSYHCIDPNNDGYGTCEPNVCDSEECMDQFDGVCNENNTCEAWCVVGSNAGCASGETCKDKNGNGYGDLCEVNQVIPPQPVPVCDPIACANLAGKCEAGVCKTFCDTCTKGQNCNDTNQDGLGDACETLADPEVFGDESLVIRFKEMPEGWGWNILGHIQMYNSASPIGTKWTDGSYQENTWWDVYPYSTTGAFTFYESGKNPKGFFDQTACGMRFNADIDDKQWDGKPASEWLCEGNGQSAHLTHGAKIYRLHKGVFIQLTLDKQVKLYSPPGGPQMGCAPYIEFESNCAK